MRCHMGTTPIHCFNTVLNVATSSTLSNIFITSVPLFLWIAITALDASLKTKNILKLDASDSHMIL